MYAQPVTLDPTFGENGMTKIPTTGISQFECFDFDKQGNIIAAGYTRDGNKYYLTIVKTSADGMIDKNFGTEGIVTSPEYNVGSTLSLKITNENKIFITGSFYASEYGSYKGTLMQFNEDGTLDKTFGENGKIITNFGINTYSRNLENDDFILYGAVDANTNLPLVLKCNYYGVIDETFGENGRAYLTDGETFSIVPRNIKILKDQSIIIVGIDNMTYYEKSAFCKISSTGNIVTDFANNGVWKMLFRIPEDIGFDYETFRNVIEDCNENLILIGSMYNWYNRDLYIVSFDPTGVINSDFGTDGVYYYPWNYLNASPLNIFQVGSNYLIGVRHTVFSINQTGILDTNFNHTGVYDFENFVFKNMKLQKPNKLILGGSYNNNFAIARLNIPYEVSIKETTAAENRINVFPNPTKDYLYFSNETKFEIMDIQGRVLIKSEKPAQLINVSHLKIGTYFVKFEDGRVGKFVKINY